MDKIKLEILGLSSSQSQTGSFALVLGEEGGNRRLPIIIGMFEAQAIAIEIEKIVPNRPMTHDLFKSFSAHFNFYVEEILISDLKEGVFYAKIICSDGRVKSTIDARPSDAIAIGLRFNVPIYTVEPIMSEAGILLSDISAEESGPESLSSSEKKTRKSGKQSKQIDDKPSQITDLTNEQLKTMLEDALKNEDYENAAKLRDELNKRN